MASPPFTPEKYPVVGLMDGPASFILEFTTEVVSAPIPDLTIGGRPRRILLSVFGDKSVAIQMLESGATTMSQLSDGTLIMSTNSPPIACLVGTLTHIHTFGSGEGLLSVALLLDEDMVE